MSQENGVPFEHTLANRRAAKKLLRKNYNDPIIAGYLELISSDSLAKQIDDLADYEDDLEDEDDIRPF